MFEPLFETNGSRRRERFLHYIATISHSSKLVGLDDHTTYSILNSSSRTNTDSPQESLRLKFSIICRSRSRT